MDITLFYAVNQSLSNSFFDWLMPIASNYRAWSPVGIALIAYLVWKEPKRGILIILLLLTAVAVSDLINHRLLKELFARIRPCNALPDVNILTGCSGSYSFPSSHAVNSFTIAVVIGLFERKLLIAAILAAATVAFSRVYLGVHYPSDVIVGALVGSGIGYLAYRMTLGKIEPKEETEKELTAK